jgi:hypothetical protein
LNLPVLSFGEWLRNVPLKKDKMVRLYNGKLKENQLVQFAVLDVTVGKENLQHCADAIMRLRAEHLYQQNRMNEIVFYDNTPRAYRAPHNSDRTKFEIYLEKVFSMCGTASLANQLKPIREFEKMEPGDILIKPGFPGHAVIVVDVATNSSGQKIYLLAQSFMPAQDIHILQNFNQDQLNPWYLLDSHAEIQTPQWNFLPSELKRF